MKLANALAERADLQKRLSELSIRLDNNARVQEGEAPAEAPQELFKELDEIMIRLEDLICRINLTNSKTEIDGQTMTALLAKRDCLRQKIQIMRSFLNSASNLAGRASRTEIRIRSTVPVAEFQKQIDAYAKELRSIDEKIQELNWTTELL